MKDRISDATLISCGFHRTAYHPFLKSIYMNPKEIKFFPQVDQRSFAVSKTSTPLWSLKKDQDALCGQATWCL